MAAKIDLNDVRILLREYLRKDGTAGRFLTQYDSTGQLISLVPNGGAPLSVLSTTMVPNLNADMVDGYHYADIVDYVDTAIAAASGLGGGASDHGDLTGLADDDHTQYHTDGRAVSWLATRSTDDLPEGTNLYFTEERVDDRVNNLIIAGSGITKSYDDASNALTLHSSNTSGDNLAIGTTVDGGAAGSVLYVNTSGTLSQAAGLTWDNSTSTLTATNISVPFGNAAIADGNVVVNATTNALLYTNSDQQITTSLDLRYDGSDITMNGDLHIAGSGVFTDLRSHGLTIPDGAQAGYVLTSDGTSGTSSWQPASAAIAAGGAITGGGPNRVLYQDAGETLATSSTFLFDGADIIVPSLKVSDLTNGRLPFVSTSGHVTDASTLLATGTAIVINQRTGVSTLSPGLAIANDAFSTANLINLYDGSVGSSQLGASLAVSAFRVNSGSSPTSSPQFTWHNDTDVGFGRPTTDSMDIWTGGRIGRFTQTGLLIGAADASPSWPLEVRGDAAVSGFLLLTPSAAPSGYVLTNNGTGRGFWGAATGGGLDIGDAITGGAANRILFEDSSNTLGESSGLTYIPNRLVMSSSSGQIVASGMLMGVVGTAVLPSLYWNTASGNAGFYQRSGNVIGLSTSGTERMTFDAGGIDVNGDVTATSKFIAGNTSGTVVGENISSQSTSGANMLAGHYSNSSSGPSLHFVKSRGSTVNSSGAAQVGDINWRITGNAYGFTAGVVLGTANRISSQIQKISPGLRPLADLRLEYPVEATASNMGTGFYLSCSGWVGILNEAPSSEFDVNGRITGDVFLSPSGMLINGPTAWSPLSPKLAVYSSDAAVGGIGINEYVQYSPSLPNGTDVFASLYSSLILPSTNTLSTTGHAIGVLGRGQDVAGTRYGMIGVEGRVDTHVGLALNQYVGTYGFAQGIEDIASSGILVGVYARAEDRVADAGAAAARRIVRALEIAPTVGGLASNKWELYQSGTNGVNYFQAQTGFGTSTPQNVASRVTVVQAGGGGVVGSIYELSGGASDYVYHAMGRTGPEFYTAVVAGTDQFMTGSIAGDVIIATGSTSNKLLLSSGLNVVPELRLANDDIRISASGMVTGNWATGGTLATSPVVGGGVGKWKFGVAEAGAGLTLITNNSLQVEVDGVKYRLALVS